MIIKVKADNPGALGGYAFAIAALALMLAVFGLVVQYSAGISLSSSNRTAAFERQLIYVPFALVAAWFAYRLNLDMVRQYAWKIFWIAMGVMFLARIPGIGVSVNGSWRWIDLYIIRLQASDLGKLALVILMAHLLAGMQRHTLPVNFKIFRFSSRSPHFFTPAGWVDFREGFLRPSMVLIAICVGIALGPDLGTIMLCCAVGGAMMYISGVRMLYIAPSVLLAVTGFVLLILNWGNRFRRILSFLDPWGRRGDEAYQLFEGMVAFGVGGVSGKGAGNGLQGRAYLPEAHTDFVFSVIGEEYGLIATGTIALIYLTIFILSYRAMRQSTDLFRLNVCLGATLFLVLQALVNMGVVTGLLPTKGISLPFISYGGTNLVIMACMIGLVLNCIRASAQAPFTPKEART
jgi:cell division protein FtsW